MQKLLRNVKAFYTTSKRSHLPWRHTIDPYKIIVSEMMLQQTQVERVVPKYGLFIKEFPSFKALAKADLGDVLLVWSGLGYNRRAKYLHAVARIVTEKYKGKFPKDSQEAEKLPGIGHYTARAVAAFAYNMPEVFIETNIRTVFIHFCFARRRSSAILISDTEILPLVERALASSDMAPREFYAALMDYGAYLKQQGIRLNSKSRHYTKQSKFEGSYRQLRGAILRALLEKPATLETLLEMSGRKKSDIVPVIAALSKEGLITLANHKFSISK
ncbi:A/G-specific adenine glycosylase [Acetobacteraceae bacterium]|nr:A/G-specific adenine glycosylase [Candidatus Parcubacteria bacterium]